MLYHFHAKLDSLLSDVQLDFKSGNPTHKTPTPTPIYNIQFDLKVSNISVSVCARCVKEEKGKHTWATMFSFSFAFGVARIGVGKR